MTENKILKPVILKLARLMLVFFLPLILYGQDTRETVAILDFEGRGISQLEAQTLTDRFRTALASAGILRLVERQMMEEVLQEQGFQQTGCTSDECAVEVGQLLGVQNMIGGAIGKVGETFTIDMRMFSVQTGENVRTKNVSYAGAVDGLITEIEILAFQMSGLDPTDELLEIRKTGVISAGPGVKPKTRFGAMVRSMFIPGAGQFYSERKRWGYTWLLSEIIIGGGIAFFGTEYQTAFDDYNNTVELYTNETDVDLIREYKDEAHVHHENMDNAATMAETLAYAAAGIWAANVLHALITGPKTGKDSGGETSVKKLPIRLAYDTGSGATMMKLTIPLRR